MNIRSAKQKGRRLCAQLKEMLLAVHRELHADDIRIPSGSENGEDLKLSPLAARAFPFAVECKNQETLNIWAALAQAAEHQASTGRTALVVFSRNRSPTYVALRLEQFLWLQAKAKNFERSISGHIGKEVSNGSKEEGGKEEGRKEEVIV